jgi:TRAP-type mannitol/chloroaromatic compound transport system substrate-binding protein
MTAQEQAAWIYHGGGHALRDELDVRFVIVSLTAGQVAAQALSWF